MAYEAAWSTPLGEVTRHAPSYQDRCLTYSRSYTVDVTTRCAKRCGYCEYRTDQGQLMPWAEVDRLLDEAARLQCREVLIMSGEEPWRLPDLGLADEGAYVDRVIEVCRRAMRRGLLPHTNVGLLSRASLAALKPWNASMGLMLESTRDDLAAHARGGGKRFAERLRHLEDAGELRIPFTTGLLVGIGETADDRAATLEAIAASHARHHHVQEVIVQNFVPKPATPMADWPAPDPATMRDAVAMARAVLPADVAVQVPPNLNRTTWPELVVAGARDLGGISLDGDSISPALPWPATDELEAGARGLGFRLQERLPVYAESAADLRAAADSLRRELVGDVVTYVINRNVNISNVCVGSCTFCGFKRSSLRAKGAYHHDRATIFAKLEDAVARGATEICMQSGLSPELDLAHYDQLFRDIKWRWPTLHLHALSPEEIRYLAELSGRSLHDVLAQLQDAGLGTLPGTAAEVLVEEVRRVLCPEKLSAQDWVDVMRSAHGLGIRTTSTIMYGHIESWSHRLRHLEVIRNLQRETHGFTEFVLLPFQVEHNTLGRYFGIARTTGLEESLRFTAFCRLYFGAELPNIQTSWVKLGADGVAESLGWGANDFGGTLMEESITRMSGADHGQNLEPEAIEAAIRAVGRVPRERTTLYGAVEDRPRDREGVSLARLPLAPRRAGVGG
ncbi:MAG TPA: 5-amino-6-(D-ribitylamino)uracil--L-tyrosine 4-hydroxyphenyl transferase CofH [Verrucomicrobiae bacterium]|nr:5-amino-6-(D-ribitylamino)uracil--L-tyrosine 4-hydroxyphenyl transferase CofH [Verrucomicrobiae bacterium]